MGVRRADVYSVNVSGAQHIYRGLRQRGLERPWLRPPTDRYGKFVPGMPGVPSAPSITGYAHNLSSWLSSLVRSFRTGSRTLGGAWFR